MSYSATSDTVAPYGLRGCLNGPAPFPGRMSYKATKPGLVLVIYYVMARYSLFVLKVPLNSKQTNKQVPMLLGVSLQHNKCQCRLFVCNL